MGLGADARRALDPGRSVVVRACAGSGKTWLLTSRIIRILLESPKLPLGAILAITFTENAAAEIKQRIKERLALLAAATEATLDAELERIGAASDAPTRKRARRLYRQVLLAQPPLTIHTFHGWFRHIMDYLPWAQRPVLTDRVLQDPRLLLQRAWRRSLSEILAEPELAAHLRTLLGRQKLGAVRAMLTEELRERRLDWLLAFDERVERGGGGASFEDKLARMLPPPEGEGIGTAALGRDAGFCAALERLVGLELTAVQRQRLAPLAKTLRAGRPPEAAALRDALLTAKGTPHSHVLKRVARQAPELATAVFGRLADALAHDAWEATAAVNRSYAALGQVVMRNFQELKLAQGVMDFGDMELAPAEAMLAGRPRRGGPPTANPVVAEMLQRMDARFAHVLIDEFQDTSPTQWWMLRTWLDASADGGDPPAVFVVGDPKQSVYSFRHADPRLLQAASDYLAKEPYQAELVEFDTTRRCSQPIVDLVNATFADAGDLAGFAPHRTTAEEAFGAIYCLPPPAAKPKGKAGGEAAQEEQDEDPASAHLRDALREPAPDRRRDEAAVAEGARLAKLLETIVGKVVIDPGDGPPRPCTVDDILLLYPVRTGVTDMLRELDRAFPCALPEAESRAETLEYQDVIALLHAVFDPNYGLMLAHALASPIFGASDDDLEAIHAAGGHAGDWVGGLAHARGSPALERAQRLLARWRELYLEAKLPAHEFLARCYAEGDVIDRYMAAIEPRLRKRVALNLEWLLNFAHEAEGGSLAQLAAFAGHLGELAAARGTGSTDSNVAGAIRVMTIHKAKGLESPVVILANADFNVPAGGSRMLAEWDLGRIEDGPAHLSFCFTPTATAAQRDVIDGAKRAREQEQANKLYVAMTRARSILIVSARPHGRKPSVAWRERLAAVLARSSEKLPTAAGFSVLRGGRPLQAGVKAEAASAPELAPVARRAEPLGRNEVHATVQSRRGTLIHNVIALTLAKVEPERIRAFLAVDRAEFAALQATCAKMVGPGSAVGGLLAAASRFECEMPLIAADGRALRVDCYLETAHEAWVIDFKTGATDRVEYAAQLRGYLAVLGGLAGGRKLRAGLVDADGRLLELGASGLAEPKEG